MPSGINSLVDDGVLDWKEQNLLILLN